MSMQVGLNKAVEAATPLLVGARAEYDGLTKATTDTRSKLEGTISLLDKARSEYEELIKRIRVVQQPPNQ
jgi:hypothetical protein